MGEESFKVGGHRRLQKQTWHPRKLFLNLPFSSEMEVLLAYIIAFGGVPVRTKAHWPGSHFSSEDHTYSIKLSSPKTEE